MIFQTVLLSFLLGSSYALFRQCDYYEELEPNTPHHLQSPGYPAMYIPGKSCRWHAVSPPNTRISLVCNEFYIPPSPNCIYDKLLISPSGQRDLFDGINFCGQRRINVTSFGNQLVLALQSFPFSESGLFSCHIYVVDLVEPRSKAPCSCGYTNPGSGNIEKGINEYPMMAGLGDLVTNKVFCGAVIISRNYILSAAHCFTDREPENVGILVGYHESTENAAPSAQFYNAESIIVHPEYTNRTYHNDIALVKTQIPIEFNGAVTTACLPFTNVGKTFVGETLASVGWGKIEKDGAYTVGLIEFYSNAIANKDCNLNCVNYPIKKQQFCAFKEVKDACVGDTGAPLLWRDPTSNVVKVLGVVSYGCSCTTNDPGVNTRVTEYLDWIKSATKEDFCVI